jgi:signal transduction histidine kinase
VQGILLHVARALQKDATQIFDFEYPSGREGRDYEVRVVRSSADEALVIVRDFSERKQLEKEVLAISAREQARIGKDLHDGLGQLLTGMAFLARALREKLSAKGAEEAEDAGHISQLALKATTQTRLLARGLFPAELETKGLTAALQELAHSLEKLHKVSCSVEVDVSLRFARKTTEKHLYRIVQEATTNAVKHGQCARVEIALCRRDGSGCLDVKDDGIGFSNSTPSPDGMGIRIMRYRARRIGGQLTIHQPESGGTQVVVQFPA